MRRLVSHGMIVVAGLLATPLIPIVNIVRAESQPVDPRLILLEKFFDHNDCPAKEQSEEFLIAADENALDWRLLPSLSLVETGGGREYKNNNIFGWGSAKQKFSSIKAGIHEVAERLSNSKLYRNKTVDQILHTYNTNPEYAGIVKKVMRSIGPNHVAPMLVY